ncbi:hypothetical protein AAMO2058_001012000 [Amorphochlora amoebiformis]
MSTESKDPSLVTGVHHVGLSVSSLPDSLKFFIEVLGYSKAGEVKEYPAVFVSNGNSFVTLWQAEKDATKFDRKKNVGLHHLALSVASLDDLKKLFAKATKFPGVKVHREPEALKGTNATHFFIFEPSGCRIEFVHWPSA